MKRLLKWVGGTLLGIVLLLVVAVLLLNTSMVQGRLVEEAVGVLKEKLQTEACTGVKLETMRQSDASLTRK